MSIADLVTPDKSSDEIEEISSKDELTPRGRPFYFDFLEHGIRRSRGNPDLRNYFSPSGCGACERCLYLTFKRMRRPPDSVSGIKRMDTGTAIHHKYELYFQQSGLLHATKFRMDILDPIHITGEPDHIVMDPSTGEFFQVEEKSRDSMAFGNQAASVGQHRYQWQLYSWMTKMDPLKRFGPEGITRGWIHYEDLNRQGWKAYPETRNDVWLEEYIAKLRRVQDAVESGGPMPDPRYTLTPKRRQKKYCKNCDKTLEYNEKLGITIN